MKVLIDDRIQGYTPEQIARWMDELPLWRREQALAYKHDAGRRQSLLAYRLLCQGLREEYGITEPPTFVYGEHGKPYLGGGEREERRAVSSGEWRMESGERLHFSLSHCREAVACVIDDHPCGIDIESVGRKVSDSLIRYAMNEEEQKMIHHSPSGEMEGGRLFLRLWTQKEAVLKLIGTGIRDTMKDVLTDCPYHIETRETAHYIVSIAVSRV